MSYSHSTIPVVDAAEVAVGLLGLTLGAGDAGGSAGARAVTVPLLGAPAADERQFCVHVLRLVHDGVPMAPASCVAYRAGGQCARAGAGVLCAAHEQGDAPLWASARDWRHIEGVGVVHRELWPSFGLAADVSAVHRLGALYESLDDDEKWALWRRWRLFLLRHSVKRP